MELEWVKAIEEMPRHYEDVLILVQQTPTKYNYIVPTYWSQTIGDFTYSRRYDEVVKAWCYMPSADRVIEELGL